jgi:hypothetical protein
MSVIFKEDYSDVRLKNDFFRKLQSEREISRKKGLNLEKKTSNDEISLYPHLLQYCKDNKISFFFNFFFFQTIKNIEAVLAIKLEKEMTPINMTFEELEMECLQSEYKFENKKVIEKYKPEPASENEKQYTWLNNESSNEISYKVTAQILF